MHKFMQSIAFAIGLLGLTATSQPAMAIVNAYVLVETTSNDLESLRSKLSSIGLANCKQLVKIIFHKDLIMSINCMNLENVNQAVTDIISGADEIVRSTIWIIKTD